MSFRLAQPAAVFGGRNLISGRCCDQSTRVCAYAAQQLPGMASRKKASIEETSKRLADAVSRSHQSLASDFREILNSTVGQPDTPVRRSLTARGRRSRDNSGSDGGKYHHAEKIVLRVNCLWVFASIQLYLLHVHTYICFNREFEI